MLTLEKTLLIIKPDSIKQNIIGKIITQFEKKNLNLIAIKMLKLEKNLAHTLYNEHKNKTFFTELVTFMTSGPIIVMILKGNNAISITRKIIGDTNHKLAKPNTIRHKFGTNLTQNAVHSSDKKLSAKREINLFFTQNEICNT